MDSLTRAVNRLKSYGVGFQEDRENGKNTLARIKFYIYWRRVMGQAIILEAALDAIQHVIIGFLMVSMGVLAISSLVLFAVAVVTAVKDYYAAKNRRPSVPANFHPLFA